MDPAVQKALTTFKEKYKAGAAPASPEAGGPSGGAPRMLGQEAGKDKAEGKGVPVLPQGKEVTP